MRQSKKFNVMHKPAAFIVNILKSFTKGAPFFRPNSVRDSGQHGDDGQPVCAAPPGCGGGGGGAAAGVEPGGLRRPQPPQNPPLSHHRSGKQS